MKWIKSLAIASIVAVSLQAESQYLCFELKGEMGEELKALVEKYHGDIKNADLQIVSPKAQQGRFANFNIEQTQGIDRSGMIERGKGMYERRCQSCHGLNAEIKAYNKSQVLNTMTAKEIELSMRGYKNGTLDRGAAFVMQPHAISLNGSQIADIAAYIEHLAQNPIVEEEEE